MMSNSAIVHDDARELTDNELEAVSGGVLPAVVAFAVGMLVGGVAVGAGMGIFDGVGEEIIKPVPGLVYN